MHKTPIRDVEMCRVTFQDVNPPAHDGRRQVVQASNVDQMLQPHAPTSSQSRANDGSSIGESDGPNVADMQVGQQAEMPLRRSTRMSRPPKRFVSGVVSPYIDIP